MNINVNIRNKTKLVEQLIWHTTKLTYKLADNYHILKTWYQIKVETLHFDQID